MAINITIRETVNKSAGAIDVSRRIFFIRPKEKRNLAILIKKRASIPMILPMIVLMIASEKPSAMKSQSILDGKVPTAEMVPISLTRSTDQRWRQSLKMVTGLPRYAVQRLIYPAGF